MEAALGVLLPASPPRRRAPAAQAPQDAARLGPPAPAAQPQGAWAQHKSRRALWREAAAPAAPQGAAQARQQQPGPQALGQRGEQAAPRRPPTPPPGFNNPGVEFHCFVNSTVQLLAAVPGFASGLEALRGELEAAQQARACAAWDPLSPPTGPRSAGRWCFARTAMHATMPLLAMASTGAARRAVLQVRPCVHARAGGCGARGARGARHAARGAGAGRRAHSAPRRRDPRRPRPAERAWLPGGRCERRLEEIRDRRAPARWPARSSARAAAVSSLRSSAARSGAHGLISSSVSSAALLRRGRALMA